MTKANESDGSLAKALLADVIDVATSATETTTSMPESESDRHPAEQPSAARVACATIEGDGSVAKELLADAMAIATSVTETPVSAPAGESERQLAEELSANPDGVDVYGDASYGTGEILAHLEKAHAIPHVKVQPPSAPTGYFCKEAFEIDLEHKTVKCPAGVLVQIRALKSGPLAEFGSHCAFCPLRAQCTKSKSGRVIRMHKHERLLQRERKRQRDPAWRSQYKATRPKIERKHAHMMRRRHGGRRARMRGRTRIAHDSILLAAATNLQRLALLMPRKE